MNASFVRDARALLSMVLDEHGHERVDRILDRSGMPAEKAVATLRQLHLEVEEEFGARQAEYCGALMGTRRDLGCRWETVFA